MAIESKNSVEPVFGTNATISLPFFSLMARARAMWMSP